MNQIPHEFICPITCDIMDDPVMCSDGYTYEKYMILNLPNSISPLTREVIDLTKLIPNRNLKDAIDRYKLLQNNNLVLINQYDSEYQENKKSLTMTKLEKFEYEQKIKNQELQIKIKNEQLEKEKRIKDMNAIKEKEKQDNILLKRILVMFNSQNIAMFPTAIFYKQYTDTYSARSIGFQFNHTFIYTIEMAISIKKQDKKLILKNYDKILNDYIWIKKYISEEPTGFVEFIFDEIVGPIDNLLEKELQIMEQNKEKIKITDVDWLHKLDELKNNVNKASCKVDLLNRIKKKLKPKEYYIVNQTDFNTDFEIGYNKILNNKTFNILHFWIKTKESIFNSLIENIKLVIQFDHANFVKYIESSWFGRNQTDIHILDMYKKIIHFKIRAELVPKEQPNLENDIYRDFKSEYFEPLMNLTKNIIELIDYITP